MQFGIMSDHVWIIRSVLFVVVPVSPTNTSFLVLFWFMQAPQPSAIWQLLSVRKCQQERGGVIKRRNRNFSSHQLACLFSVFCMSSAGFTYNFFFSLEHLIIRIAAALIKDVFLTEKSAIKCESCMDPRPLSGGGEWSIAHLEPTTRNLLNHTDGHRSVQFWIQYPLYGKFSNIWLTLSTTLIIRSSFDDSLQDRQLAFGIPTFSQN